MVKKLVNVNFNKKTMSLYDHNKKKIKKITRTNFVKEQNSCF